MKLLREVWISLINNDKRFQAVLSCKNWYETILGCDNTNPAILLIDEAVIPASFNEENLKFSYFFETRGIIVVARKFNIVSLRRMFNAGAAGYLTKDSAVDELTAAMAAVINGSTYISGNDECISSE